MLNNAVLNYGGYVQYPNPLKKVRYNGEHLTYFMVKNGLLPEQWQEFLQINKTTPFELEIGEEVFLPSVSIEQAFPSHLEV